MAEKAPSPSTRNNISNFFNNMTNTRLYTLIFVRKKRKLLLGLKKRGIGMGLWNGFGGKVEPYESITDGAKRELKEESNLDAPDMRQLGVVTYTEENDEEASIVHVFTANKYNGIITPTEEMNPIQWYGPKDIPYEQMWPDAKYWFPVMLDNRNFSAFVRYDQNGKIRKKFIHQFDNIQDVLKHNWFK